VRENWFLVFGSKCFGGNVGPYWARRACDGGKEDFILWTQLQILGRWNQLHVQVAVGVGELVLG